MDLFDICDGDYNVNGSLGASNLHWVTVNSWFYKYELN